MNTKIQIFLGAPFEIESERLFLRQLCSDLEARGQSALVFANFHLPLNNPVHQIDFLVILERLVCHVELKNLTAPVFGGANGPWHLRMPDGAREPLDRKNPFKQALDCKYAISDAMHGHCTKNCPNLQAREKFFKQIESVVGIFPELCDGSEVVSNQHVRVLGYPDLLELLGEKMLAPRWTFDDWKSFATELGLVQYKGDRSAEGVAIKNYSRAVADYERRFREIHQNDLHEIIATTIKDNDEEKSSKDVLSCLSEGGHVQFIGPSGCGKSHHAVHSSMRAFDVGRIPILARAKNYRGKLSNLVNESIAHLYPGAAIEFFSLAKRVGKSIALVIDGFNECPSDLQPALIKDLLAIYIRWQFPVLITGQERISLPEELSGSVVRFHQPNKEQRLEILNLYSGNALPEAAARLCDAFTTSLELKLAADCIKDLVAVPTRAILFDSYLRHRCGDALDASLTRRVLSEIAASMSRKFQSRLAVAEVWQIGENVIDQHGARLTALGDILQSGFLEFQHGSCSFRHEMFQRYFEAVALRRSAGSATLISDELRKPQNFALSEFILGMTTEPEELRQVLVAASKSNPQLVTDSLLGSFGDSVRSVVKADARKAIETANEELKNIDARVVKSESDSGQVTIEVVTSEDGNHSPYHRVLINSIRTSLPHGLFVDDVFRLIANTESAILTILEKKYGEGVRRPGFLSTFVHQLYVLRGPQPTLSAFGLVRALDNCHRCDTTPEVITYLKGQIADVSQLSLGELYLTLDLLGVDASPFEEQVTPLLQYCWASEVYHIRLKILQRIGSWGALKWRSREQEGEGIWAEVVESLRCFETSNIMLSTQLVETLFAFDVIEPPWDSDAVSHDLQLILANFDHKDARAYD